MTEFISSVALLLVLLNPFLVVVYIIDVMQKLDRNQFNRVLIRAGLIASVVFCCFAILGDSLFSDVLQVHFASFQIFGGLIFVFIGFQFVFHGPTSIEILRGESQHLSGAIAMPILIGPGSISASIIIGEKNDVTSAIAAVLVAVFISVVIMLLLKRLHDYVRPRWEGLVHRYIEIAGRITALYIGTVAIEMVMQGTRVWVMRF